MARITYVPVVAAGLLAAVIDFSINSAFAIDDCLLQPNRQTAPGEHWYYRSDPENNRKCWHIGQSGIKAPQEASVTPSDYPTSLQAENAPSTQPEQPNEQRDQLTNPAENFEQ
jgi:hypothetical protein